MSRHMKLVGRISVSYFSNGLLIKTGLFIGIISQTDYHRVTTSHNKKNMFKTRGISQTYLRDGSFCRVYISGFFLHFFTGQFYGSHVSVNTTSIGLVGVEHVLCYSHGFLNFEIGGLFDAGYAF